jgi:hypothetical protein
VGLELIIKSIVKTGKAKKVQIKNAKIFLAIVSLAGLLLVSITGCGTLQKLMQNPDYIYENGAVLVDGGGDPIRLTNNPAAADATYKEVLAFITLDTTDQIQYIERGNTSGARPFVCSDFARSVHNNAEKAGIRAGYVSIDWADGGIGHAINAFETSDLGLVYLDCTGKSIFSQIEENDSKTTLGSWDKVAYLELGKGYGVIGLAFAGSPDYAFFEEYDKQWAEFKQLMVAYNAEVKLYNREIEGKVFHYGTSEYQRIRFWEQELIKRENELDAIAGKIGKSRFKPLGVVSNFEIHW